MSSRGGGCNNRRNSNTAGVDELAEGKSAVRDDLYYDSREFSRGSGACARCEAPTRDSPMPMLQGLSVRVESCAKVRDSNFPIRFTLALRFMNSWCEVIDR